MCIVHTAVGKREEATSNNEEIKPVTLSIVELCLAGGISYVVSQHLKTFIEGFVKTFLGLAVPNQCCQAVMKGN